MSLCQLKFFASLKSGEAIDSADIHAEGEYPVYGGNGLRGYSATKTHTVSAPLIGRQGALCGNVNYAEGDFYATEHAIVATPHEGIHPRWLYWLLSSLDLNQYSMAAAQPGLAVEVIERVRANRLPHPQQERIAHFLDEQTARIDALIAEKEKLRATLKEAAWDEVTRAVTVGIAGAPTRATGLDWCPFVPKHWGVPLLKRILQRTEYGISDSMAPEGKIAVLRMGNIFDGEVLMEDLKFVEEVPGELLLRPGDLLYNRTNSLAQVGKVGLVREMPAMPVTFASYLVRLVPNERVLSDYLAYLLNCPDILAIARSLALPAIGQANLNPTRYGYIHVPCPPVTEQREIVRFLDTRTSQITALAEHAVEHIARLREYRSSLISAAVTGQLQVPGTVRSA